MVERSEGLVLTEKFSDGTDRWRGYQGADSISRLLAGSDSLDDSLTCLFLLITET